MQTKRNTKDSVFTDLFSDPKYQLQLYKELNPDSDAKLEDIQDVTIESIFTTQHMNDLGFIVKDEILFLVEAQSTWSENILLRVLFYYMETMKRRIKERKLNVYSTTKIQVLKPKFYVVYTGESIVEDIITFKDSFFSQEKELDFNVSVHVIHDAKEISKLSSQYILFSQIFDEQRRKYGYSMKAIEETLRICKNKHILESYIQSKEGEVTDIMTYFMNQKEAWELTLIEENAKVAEEVTKKVTKEVSKKKEKDAIYNLAKFSKKYGISKDACYVDVLESYPDFGEEQIKEIISTVYQ